MRMWSTTSISSWSARTSAKMRDSSTEWMGPTTKTGTTGETGAGAGAGTTLSDAVMLIALR